MVIELKNPCYVEAGIFCRGLRDLQKGNYI